MRKKRISIFLLTLVMTVLIGQFSFAFAINLNPELMTNGGGETGSISGWTDDTGAGRWSSSAARDWALPAEGSRYFYLFNPSMEYSLSGTMSQEITLTDTNGLFSSIAAGNISLDFDISMFQNISAYNEAKAILEEYDSGNNLLKASQVVNTTFSGTMGSYHINTQLRPETRKIKVLLSATLTKGGYAQFDKISMKLADASGKSAPVFGSGFPSSAETDAGATYTSSFTISDADAGDVNNLTFSSSTTNVNLVPAANITVSGSGASRTLNIVPAGNLSGEADITVSASDGTKSAEKTFHFIVHKVISMNTNLVENGNGTSGFANWTGNENGNITTSGNGFSTSSPNTYIYQKIDISKFYTLIDGGETKFSLSADFTTSCGAVSAKFYTDIACTNMVGSSFIVNRSAASMQKNIPANAKGLIITFNNTSSGYSTTVTVENLSFQIVNDFPKIPAISDRTTNLSALTVPVHPYYTTTSATLTATSSDQTIVPNSGFTYGGSGFNRTVTFTPLKNGIVTIAVTLNDGTASNSQSFSVNAVEPAVVSSVGSPAEGYYTSGGQLDFTAHFNHNITGGTDSRLPLTIGGKPASASYLSSTANSITYRYTVASGDDGAVAIVGPAIDDSSSNITDTSGFDANTNISASATGVTVIQAPTVTSSSASSTYGDKITFSATLSCADSLIGTIQFKANGTNLGSPVTVSGNTASIETTKKPFDVGSVSITAEFVGDSSSHFTILTSNGLTVNVQPLPVSVSGFTADPKEYDGTTAVKLSGGSLTGVLSGDTLYGIYPTAGTAADKNAGTRPVTFTAITLGGADKDNYVLSAQPTVNVVISPKAVTATVSVNNKTYNGNTDATVTCGFDKDVIVAGDEVSATATGTFENKDAGTEKTVTISNPETSGTEKGNYSVTVPLSGKADINPLAITVTPDAVSKVYGHADTALTYKITSGDLVASETLAGGLKRDSGENVGAYEIAQDTLTNANNSNYNITFTTGVKLTITEATPVVTVSADKATQMTGKDVVVTVTVAYPSKRDTDDYPATVSITPVNASAKGAISVSGNNYSQTFTIGSDLATPVTFSASVAANGNYSGASSASPATVAIFDRYTPAVSVTSDKGLSATYGDTVTFTAKVSDPNGTPKGTVRFFVDAAACGSAVTLVEGTASLSVAAAPLVAGSRSVTAQYTPADKETNYKTNTSSAFSLTVSPKPVSITGLSATARDYNGTVNVELTGGTISDTLSGAALTANIPTVGTIPDKNAGTRPVTFTTIVLSGANKDNYILSAQPIVSVKISPKAVMATVSVNNKTYNGNTDATVTCGFDKDVIVAGDEVSATATGTFDTKDAGTEKTVTISNPETSGTEKGNYSVTIPLSGKADINPLAITVTPNAVTKTYGQNDPALTYKITSSALVASETLAGGLKRDSGENVGTYEIKPDDTLNNTNNPNYMITFNPSEVYLTVSEAAPVVSVTSNKATPVYGDTLTFTATVKKSGSGVLPTGSVQFWLGLDKMGSPIALTSGIASYTTTQTELLPGSISVTAQYVPDAGEKNYQASSCVYTATVTQREVTVKADDKTIYVGSTIPAAGTLTYTITGLIGSDTLVTLPTLSLPTDTGNDKVADFAISVTGAAVNGNYTVKMVNGTLHITAAPAFTSPQTSNTVVAPATTKTDGTAVSSVTTSQISQAASAALQEAVKQDTSAIVEIKVQGAEHADAVAVTVPKSAVETLTESKLDGLRLNTSVGTLTFDAKALSAISQSAGENINMKMEALDTTKLTSAVQEAVGDRPVFDFTITSGDKTISSFGGGSVTVGIPYALKEGEDPNAIVVYYVDDAGNMTPVHSRFNKATGTAVFTVTHFSRYIIGYSEATFNDVSKNAWYYDAVTFCAAREITTGIGNSMFDPDATLTRGQFIVFLMRAYGLAPDESPVNNFTDAGNTYYTGYLASAKKLGIINGAGQNMFMPEKAITRQDMFTMLYRTMDILKVLPKNSSNTSLSKFSDASTISDYATEAVKRFAEMGIISGSVDNLNPLGCATRAQMVQILYNLLSK